ncbi:MAG TPA: hypothetical protein VFV34_24075 [Blastocatellia bacterium]|nr:hypothetical protein [Blastocatellia bacterium]
MTIREYGEPGHIDIEGNPPVNDRFPDSENVVAYLLGELSPSARKETELRYFADPAFLEYVDAVEEELADAYVRGELSPARRERFERFLSASPRQQERVALARALQMRAASSTARTTPPVPSVTRVAPSWRAASRWLALAAISALMLITTWLGIQNVRLRDSIAAMRRDQDTLITRHHEIERQLAEQRKDYEQLAEELASIKIAPENRVGTLRPEQLASLLLLPGIPRSPGSVPNVVISPQVRTVSLSLVVDGPISKSMFVASISSTGADQLWNGSAHQSRGRSDVFLVTVPARVLTEGEFVLTLSTRVSGELQPIADYSFTVSRR